MNAKKIILIVVLIALLAGVVAFIIIGRSAAADGRRGLAGNGVAGTAAAAGVAPAAAGLAAAACGLAAAGGRRGLPHAAVVAGGAAAHGAETFCIAGLAGATRLGRRSRHRRGRTATAAAAGIAAARSTAGIATAPGLGSKRDRDHSCCSYCDQGKCGQAFHGCVFLV